MDQPKDRAGVTITDVELAGDILRVVTAGLPKLGSTDAKNALLELRQHHEPFRAFLNDPRNGKSNVNSCLLYPPWGREADCALFLASRFAYAPLAGTALMAAATVLVDQGQVALAGPEKEIVFETATGMAKVEVQAVGSVVRRARWVTARPRLLAMNTHVPRSDGRPMSVSIVYSGLPYLVVADDDLGVSIDDRSNLGAAAAALSAAAMASHPITRFGLSVGDYVQYLVMVTSQIADNHIRAVWISDKGEIANSAGGTGALSVAAAAEAAGRLQGGIPVTIEAPGGAFECQMSRDRATVASGARIVAKRELIKLSGATTSD